jgi:hypothetical protein
MTETVKEKNLEFNLDASIEKENVADEHQEETKRNKKKSLLDRIEYYFRYYHNYSGFPAW